MEQIISLVSARRHDFELALRSRERLHQLFKEYLQGLEGNIISLIFMYRSHFPSTDKQSGKTIQSELLDPPEPLQVGFVNDAQAHVHAIETMSQYIQKISGEYENALNSLDTIWSPVGVS
jgi:hypothetical protein